MKKNVPSVFDDSFISNFIRNFSLFDDSSFPSLNMEEEQKNISLSEDKDNVYLEAKVPGIKEKDLEITMDKNVVWIKGSKIAEENKEDKKYYYKSSSECSYRVALPGSIDESQDPEIKLSDGMLSFTFKKQKSSAMKKLNING